MKNSVTKICTKCNKKKALPDFSNFKYGKLGKLCWCKECKKKADQQYYENHKEEHGIRCKEWRSVHKDELVEYQRIYRENNKEQKKENDRRWQQQNKEKADRNRKNWIARNPEKNRQCKRDYDTRNPEVTREKTRNRRARTKFNGGKVTTEEWLELVEFYGNKCLCCGKKGVKLTMDHVIPLVKGGKHAIENCQPLCKSCNCKKSSKIIDYRPKS
jgi:hypothetical protein